MHHEALELWKIDPKQRIAFGGVDVVMVLAWALLCGYPDCPGRSDEPLQLGKVELRERIQISRLEHRASARRRIRVFMGPSRHYTRLPLNK